MADQELEVSTLLTNLVTSLTGAAEALSREMNKEPWTAQPAIYVIPKMDVEVRLSLSYSESKMKGFLHKTSNEKSSDILSTLSLSVVAIPRSPKA